jgi:hypothetical protein
MGAKLKYGRTDVDNLGHKRYEDMGDWELKFEQEVMDSLNLEYVEEDTMGETLQAASKDAYGNITKVITQKKPYARE